VALTTHPRVAPTLQKEYSSNPAVLLGLIGLFWGEMY